MKRAFIYVTLAAAAVRLGVTRWLTGWRYHRDRVTGEFWQGWDTGTEGSLSLEPERDLPYFRDGSYYAAPLAGLPPEMAYAIGEMPALNVPGAASSPPAAPGTLNLPAGERARVDRGPEPATTRPAATLSDDSGLIPAVTAHIADALGVPSRTRWLDREFDRILLDLHAEMAIIEHRFAYQAVAA